VVFTHLVPCPTQQVTFPHKPHYFLAIRHPSLALQLFGNPAISVTRKPKADSFYAVYQISFCFHLVRTFGRRLVIETAPRQFHQSTPPLDIAEEAPPLRNDFPFLLDWLRLFGNPFFKNSFSRVSLHTSSSS
jgi:hypothetical protein